jgi:hypothetical protein
LRAACACRPITGTRARTPIATAILNTTSDRERNLKNQLKGTMRDGLLWNLDLCIRVPDSSYLDDLLNAELDCAFLRESAPGSTEEQQL